MTIFFSKIYVGNTSALKYRGHSARSALLNGIANTNFWGKNNRKTEKQKLEKKLERNKTQ